jgi:hypothetical protein
MAIIKFVTETEIKEKSPISNNTDIKLISDSVEYAQDAYIQDVLGTNLYNDIQTKFSAGTLSTIEQQLVDLIKPALIYRSIEQALPFMQSQIVNKGIVHKNSEFSQQADISYMRYLREELKGRTQFLTERIIKFLCNNKTSFPLYVADNDDINPTSKNGYYDCDLYLDSNNGCSCGKTSCNCN